MEVRTGQAVLVPFAGRELVGFVMGVEPRVAGFKGALKPLRAVVKEEPLFGADLTRLIRAVSDYYRYPIGLCVREILPGGLAPRLVKEAELSETGLAAASDPSLPETDPLKALFDALPDSLPLSSFKGKGQAERLGALARKGLVKIIYVLAGKGAAFAYEVVIGPVPDPPEELPKLGKVERQLWERLKGAPPTPLSHFRHYVKSPMRIASALQAKGLVVMEKVEICRDDPNRAPDLPRTIVEKLTEEQEAALGNILAAVDRALDAGPVQDSGWEGVPVRDPRSGSPEVPGGTGGPCGPGGSGWTGGPGGPGAVPDGCGASVPPASPGRFLLFGVTGSGKTEVYLRAAARVLSRGGGVLWLTPEIALTLGLEARIKQSLPNARLAVLHSGLSAGERHDHWMNLARGRVRLALGARSAVFAPVKDLKLVIVDEEHDWAYKQEDGLRYHGRDVANWRARESGAVLVLGSATPSLESYRAAEAGRLELLAMKERPGDATLPKVKVCDRRKSPKGGRILSPELRNELLAAFQRGEQALLFVNRRGWASLPICISCGEAMKCPSCSLNLTLHGPEGPPVAGAEEGRIRGIPDGSLLVCHGCGWRGLPPKACPSCGAGLVRYVGAGTERILASAEKDFKVPGIRLDADSTRKKGGLKAVLEAFGKGQASFLVGTQMAAKCHDFPNLTVVGVVDADIGLNLPDFRAAERTYQLLSQVSGRAGRAVKPGRVIIQTLNPDHYSVAAARSHDYLAFYKNEAAMREELGLPPFGKLALLRFWGPDEERASLAADKAGELLRGLARGREEGGFFILGPAPSPVVKLRERFRFQMMVRASSSKARGELLSEFAPQCRKQLPKAVAFAIDVDPYHLL
jgi:primosomal protein N' (replication factor Y)